MAASITIKGIPEFYGKLRELQLSVQRENLTKAAKAGAEIIVSAARASARHQSVAKGLKIEADRDSSYERAGVVFGWGSKTFHAYFLEFGTGRYFATTKAREFGKPGRGGGIWTIAPKKKGVLADRGAGEVFGKRVTHPGIQPQPILGPAIERYRDEAIERAGAVLAALINKV